MSAADVHLGSLERLRRKLALLDAQAGAPDELEAAEQEAACGQLLKAVRSSSPAPRAPASSAASDAVSDLKMYLEAVLDADRAGDDVLLAITQQHCIAFAVKVINEAEGALVPLDKVCCFCVALWLDLCQHKGNHQRPASRPTHRPPLSNPHRARTQAMRGVVDLAASTLCTLSQRASARELLLNENAVPALVSLLTPSHHARAVTDAAAALGNLSSDPDCGRAVRSGGGVGALVRLLRPDAPSSMQAAAAAALCLLAARDAVVQDSVRYLGGIDLLVDLLASPRSSVAEVAR